jgi:hypothetical protein
MILLGERCQYNSGSQFVPLSYPSMNPYGLSVDYISVINLFMTLLTMSLQNCRCVSSKPVNCLHARYISVAQSQAASLTCALWHEQKKDNVFCKELR